MSHNFFWNANFHLLLNIIDQDLATQAQQEGCPQCGHKLHQANYPRSPVGMPLHFRSYYDERLSFCCEICRQRMTPASVRFFGRRWYPGPLFVLISALLRGITESLLREIKGSFGILMTPSTLKRWRQWWDEVFPLTSFWKQASGLIPPLDPDLGLQRSFPRALLDLFQGRLEEKICLLLKFLSPLTWGVLQAF